MLVELQEIFFDSFQLFVARDRDNIMNGTSERNLCACWAPLLEIKAHESGFSEYRADPEYNRKQKGQLKTIFDENESVITITCDLILHSRGSIPGRDNLIAIEMKRSKHPNAKKEKDRARLRALTKTSFDGVWSADGKTHPEHVCGYVLGYFVELYLARQFFRIEEYQHGEFVSHSEHYF